jgi:hypothetical protein
MPSPRHGRPCAGHPDPGRRGAFQHRDHRHKAGDDGWGMTLSLVTRFLIPGHALLGRLSLVTSSPSWPGLSRPSRSCETLRPQPIEITGPSPVMTRRVSFPAGAQRREGNPLAREEQRSPLLGSASRPGDDTAHHPGLVSAMKRRMPLCHFSAKKRIDTSPVESLPISKTFAESSPIGSYTGHCYAIPRSKSEHMSNEVKTWKRSRKADASNPYEYAAIRLKGNT